MKISIITVVYNGVKYIETCIKSIMAQTYKDIEYIIIDGKSSDGTLEIINHYKNQVSVIISEKDNGHIFAMNKGLKIATGDIVGFLHSDDFYTNNKVVEKVMQKFSTNTIDSLYGDLVYVVKNKPGKIVRFWKGSEYSIEKIKKGWMPPHPTYFVKRNIYEKYGFLNTAFKISVDYELILRFLYKHHISVYYLPETLVNMRLGGVSNRNILNMIRKSLEDFKACRMYGLSLGTVIRKNMRKISQFGFGNQNMDNVW